MQNLVLTRSGSGALFTATEDSLRHRLVRFADLSAPGSYRVTVETRYAGTSQMAIEIGGPGQPYAIVKVNLKDGVVTDSQGALGAGVDQLSKPGSYRWWVDLDLNPGRFITILNCCLGLARSNFRAPECARSSSTPPASWFSRARRTSRATPNKQQAANVSRWRVPRSNLASGLPWRLSASPF